jgi:hypothetical protein
MMSGTELVRYDAMCQAIAAAYEVDEIKEIRDKAAALEHYARQARNTEAERQCAEIRLRAERRAGQLLRQMDKAKGSAQSGVGRRGENGMRSESTTTLRELGITKDQSSQWQRLAAIPEAEFESALAGPDKPTLGGIIKGGGSKPVERDGEVAARLWIWLSHWDRYGLLGQAPASEVVRTMTPETRDYLRERLPRVIGWLQEVEQKLSDFAPELVESVPVDRLH